jgi:hypothetical protein
MVLLPVKQYYPQTDSATGHGDRMCFSSTCAMAIKYLVPGALLGSNADDDYLRTVLKYGDTTEYTSHLKACQQYGVFATFSQKVNGGYITIGSGGKDVKYSWRNWLPRWEVEGRGSGWFMTFRPMQQQQPITPVDNTFKGVKAAAKTAGAKFPQVVAAQWALESGYGKHFSGTWNAFGLKGSGTERETKEFINGQWVTIKAGFIDFPDLQTCVSYLVDRWYRDYQRYKGVNRATTAEECARLLVTEGYATDPQYAEKLIRIMKENG